MSLAQRQLGNSAATCYTKVFDNSSKNTPAKPESKPSSAMSLEIKIDLSSSAANQLTNNAKDDELGFCHHCK